MEPWALSISIVALIVSGGSVAYTRQQAAIASKAHAHETEANLRLSVRGFGASTRWVLENLGKAPAFSVRLRFSFDTSGRDYGKQFLGRLDAEAEVELMPTKPWPSWSTLMDTSRKRRGGVWVDDAAATWETADGARRSKTIEINAD